MWKLIKTEFRYNKFIISVILGIKLVSGLILILIPPRKNYFMVIANEWLMNPLPAILIIVLLYKLVKEKRDSLYSILPVKLLYTSISRILFLISPLVIIHLINTAMLYLGTILNIHRSRTIYAAFTHETVRAGSSIMIMASIIILIDIFFLLRKGNVILKISETVILTGSLIILGILFNKYMQDFLLSDVLIKYEPNKIIAAIYLLIVPNTFVLFGIFLAFLAVIFYRMRRSYV